MKNNKTNRKSRITRRRFMGAAASVAAFTIVPRHVLGQTVPSNLVNIAVVGSGGHGAFVITQMLKAGGINVVALCDVDSRATLKQRNMVVAKSQASTRSSLMSQNTKISGLCLIKSRIMSMRL